MNSPRVLVVGYRKSLLDTLSDMGVSWFLWAEGPAPARLSADQVRVVAFGKSAHAHRQAAAEFRDQGPFAFVIAATEGAVVPASMARRVLGARMAPHTTALRCHDKLFMKQALASQGVPMTSFADGNRISTWDQVKDALGAPVVVKDRRQSGGRGIDIVQPGDLDKVPIRGRLLERFINAPEASVESFVVDGNVVFQNVTSYVTKRHVNLVPGNLDESTQQALKELARRAIKGLRISWGITHMEAYLHPDGLLFGEIALRPPGGYIMNLMSMVYGFDAWRAFASVEMGLPFVFPSQNVGHAAAWVIHPGAGKVTSVSGWQDVVAHPDVRAAQLKVKVGDLLSTRAGAGNEVGHLLLQGDDANGLLASVAAVHALLRIEMAPEG